MKYAQIERPLDLLNDLKEQEVLITLKTGKEINAVLLAFDIHINLVVDEKGKLKFLRGDLVQDVAEVKK
jgi:small nuclear ribonucleoprotein (snRNP)-like protein